MRKIAVLFPVSFVERGTIIGGCVAKYFFHFSQIITKLADPDATNGQQERYSIDNVAFTELPFMNYKMGEVNQQKLPFTFRPSDLVCLDSIRAAD